MFKDYYSLTKSGLVYGNLITVIGGFALGAARAGDGINFGMLFATFVGISFVMASGCVFNNYIDRDIDAKMPRTKNRVLVTGKISGQAAITFAIVLGSIGFATLALFTNILTVAVAASGFFAYVVLYSLWAKRRTVHGTIVGAISGATPPVVGYVAASEHLDIGALLLFVILLLWQMPHFYAIAIRRADEYAVAKIPVLPVAHGVRSAKIAMFLYIVGFIAAASLLTVFGYTGFPYLLVTLILGLAWLILCIQGFKIAANGIIGNGTSEANKIWAKKMFFFSLFVMVALFATITVGAIR